MMGGTRGFFYKGKVTEIGIPNAPPLPTYSDARFGT
jgi:hypothetical protein